MTLEEFIQMMEARGYADDAPIIISTDSPAVYVSDFGKFKKEFREWKIY
jgi:hypothetical protein